jgi:aminodeoxyfutalosine synthase
MSTLLDSALENGAAGRRLDPDQALAVAGISAPDQLHRLGRAALANRRARFGDQATYVCNLQVNPTNLCEGGCRFCRYAAQPGDDHAYVLDEEEILARVEQVQPSEVHIVGGLNQVWGFKRSRDLVAELRRRRPGLFIKAFTAVEIDWFARQQQTGSAEILGALQAAGLDSLPGGGAELFSPALRARLCPDKLSAEGWLAIHRQAHQLGLSSNATMLYGCGESPSDRVEHLLALRELQDESGGFSCFIPLAFQSGAAAAGVERPSPLQSLLVIGLARLVLDNIPHVKAYWPMIGLETAAAALSWGADDLDGTIGQERIAHAAGASSPVTMAREQMAETIRLGGFAPAERDGRFMPRETA